MEKYTQSVDFFGPSNVEVYDTFNSAWKFVENMATGRVDHTSSVVDGVIYVIGGNDGMTKVEAFAP